MVSVSRIVTLAGTSETARSVCVAVTTTLSSNCNTGSRRSRTTGRPAVTVTDTCQIREGLPRYGQSVRSPAGTTVDDERTVRTGRGRPPGAVQDHDRGRQRHATVFGRHDAPDRTGFLQPEGRSRSQRSGGYQDTQGKGPRSRHYDEYAWNISSHGHRPLAGGPHGSSRTGRFGQTASRSIQREERAETSAGWERCQAGGPRVAWVWRAASQPLRWRLESVA